MVSDEPADHALGRSRGNRTTKLHLACEQGQKPLAMLLTRPQPDPMWRYAMAWMEQHGPHYRVRYRYAGRTVLDGTYDTVDAAHARITRREDRAGRHPEHHRRAGPAAVAIDQHRG